MPAPAREGAHPSRLAHSQRCESLRAGAGRPRRATRADAIAPDTAQASCTQHGHLRHFAVLPSAPYSVDELLARQMAWDSYDSVQSATRSGELCAPSLPDSQRGASSIVGALAVESTAFSTPEHSTSTAPADGVAGCAAFAERSHPAPVATSSQQEHRWGWSEPESPGERGGEGGSGSFLAQAMQAAPRAHRGAFTLDRSPPPPPPHWEAGFEMAAGWRTHPWPPAPVAGAAEAVLRQRVLGDAVDHSDAQQHAPGGAMARTDDEFEAALDAAVPGGGWRGHEAHRDAPSRGVRRAAVLPRLTMQHWLDVCVAEACESGAQHPKRIAAALESLLRVPPEAAAAQRDAAAAAAEALLRLIRDVRGAQRATLLNLLGDVAAVHSEWLAGLVVGAGARLAGDVGAAFEAAAGAKGTYNSSLHVSEMATAQGKLRHPCALWWDGLSRAHAERWSARALSTVVHRAVVLAAPPHSAAPPPDRLWRDLAAVVAVRARSMDAQGVVNCLWALARAERLGWHHACTHDDDDDTRQACVSALLVAAGAKAAVLTPQGVALALWAAGVLVARHKLPTHAVRALLNAASVQGRGMRVHDAVGGLHALRWLGVPIWSEPGCALQHGVLAGAAHMHAQDAAALLWCLGVTHSTSAGCVERLRLAALRRAAVQCERLRPQDVGVALWSLAVASRHVSSDAAAAELDAALTPLLAVAQHAAPSMAPAAVTSSLAALARLRGTHAAWAHAAPHAPATTALVGAAAAAAPALDGRLASTALWALATLEAPCSADTRRTMCAAAERELHSMTSREVANVLWSLATLRWDVPPALAAALPAALAHCAGALSPRSMHQALTGVWGLGLALEQRVAEAVVRRLAEVAHLLSGAALADCCLLAGALGWREVPVLREAVAAALECGAVRFDQQRADAVVCAEFAGLGPAGTELGACRDFGDGDDAVAYGGMQVDFMAAVRDGAVAAPVGHAGRML